MVTVHPFYHLTAGKLFLQDSQLSTSSVGLSLPHLFNIADDGPFGHLANGLDVANRERRLLPAVDELHERFSLQLVAVSAYQVPLPCGSIDLEKVEDQERDY